MKQIPGILRPQTHWIVRQYNQQASKTVTLDLCQLPRPPYEIHKMINLPASVTIFKNKLKNLETDKSYFHLPRQAKTNDKLEAKAYSPANIESYNFQRLIFYIKAILYHCHVILCNKNSSFTIIRTLQLSNVAAYIKNIKIQ